MTVVGHPRLSRICSLYATNRYYTFPAPIAAPAFGRRVQDIDEEDDGCHDCKLFEGTTTTHIGTNVDGSTRSSTSTTAHRGMEQR